MSSCKFSTKSRYLHIDLTECALFSKLFSKEIREHEVQGIVIDVDQVVKDCLATTKKMNEFSND